MKFNSSQGGEKLMANLVENSEVSETGELPVPLRRCNYGNFGSGGRDRTYDQLINSRFLSDLQATETVAISR
jgi:hypothetical protein